MDRQHFIHHARRRLFWFFVPLILIWFAMFVSLSHAHAQGITKNTWNVLQFPGNTVGAKVTAAQAACDLNTSVPCILVFDPFLVAWPQGTLPTACTNCVWVRWDQGGGTAKVNGTANEMFYPGSTLQARVSAACTAVGAGVVLIPSLETDNTFQLAGQMAEGCFVRDERGDFLVKPSGVYQFTSGASTAEGVIEWMQMNTATSSCCTNKFMHQWVLEANSGGYNSNPGTKTNYTTLQTNMVRRTPGQGEVLQLAENNYSSLGDVVGISYSLLTNAMNVGGDEGLDIMGGQAQAGLPAFTGTISSINGSTVTLTPIANPQNIGEQNFLLNTSRGTYSSGTASITGTPPVITGTGTAWSSLCPGGTAPCSPTDLYFEFTGEAGIAAAQTHVVMPIATISTDTSATLALQSQGANISYTGSITGSAAYKIYRGSVVTAVPSVGNVWTTVFATLSSTADFQAGDSVMDVGGAFSHLSGIRIQQYQNLPQPGNATSNGLGVTAFGPYPIGTGVSVSTGGPSPAGYSYAYVNADWSSASTTPLYGVRINGPAIGNGFILANDPANSNLENLLCTLNSGGSPRCLAFDRGSGNNFWNANDLKWTSDGTGRMEIGGSNPQSSLQLFQYIGASYAPTYTARQVNYYANPNSGTIMERIDIQGVPIWYIKSTGSGNASAYINNGNSLIFQSGNQTGQTASINASTGAASFTSLTVNGGVVNGMQSGTVGGCTTGSSAGSVCNVTITWPQSFASTTYKVSCTGSGITGAPAILGTGPYLGTGSQTTTTTTVFITNGQGSQAVASGYTSVNCLGLP